MRRLIIFAVLFVVLLSPSGRGWRAAPGHGRADGSTKVQHDVADRVRERGHARVFVLMRERQTSDINGFAVIHRFKRVPAVAGEIDARGLEQLESDPNVEAVEIDGAIHGADAESLPLIGGNVVQAMGFRGDGVVVGVIDSGFDPNHADLKDVAVDEQCFCGNSCCPNKESTQSGTGAARDEHGHGTNVTGIIVSRGTVAPIGVAPGAKIVAVRVLDSQNRGFVSDMVAGLEWIADHHPEVRAINMSVVSDAHYSGTCDGATASTQAFSRIAKELRARGTLVFACAGNTGSSTTMGSPACVDPIVAVGAVDDSSFGFDSFGGVCGDPATAPDQIACFSDSSSALDLLAPGSLITSTGLNATRSTFHGTSQATPHVTGAAAVLIAMKPELSATAVEELLKTTGKPLVDARNGVTTPRIDLLAAVQALQKIPPKRRAARH